MRNVLRRGYELDRREEELVTIEQLEELQVWVSYSYVAGDIPDTAPEWVQQFMAGDGGYLKILSMFIAERKRNS